MKDLSIYYDFNSIGYKIDDFNEELQIWLAETKKQGAVYYEIDGKAKTANNDIQSIKVEIVDNYRIVIIVNDTIRCFDDIVITAYTQDADDDLLELSDVFMRENW